MSLIRKKNEGKKSERYFSVRLPKAAHNYLAMHALTYNKTKTQIVRDQVNVWIEVNKETDIVDKFAKKLNSLFEQHKCLNPSLTIIQFKRQIEQELLNEGMDKEYISIVLKNVTDE
jgi:hypothetical protein